MSMDIELGSGAGVHKAKRTKYEEVIYLGRNGRPGELSRAMRRRLKSQQRIKSTLGYLRSTIVGIVAKGSSTRNGWHEHGKEVL